MRVNSTPSHSAAVCLLGVALVGLFVLISAYGLLGASVITAAVDAAAVGNDSARFAYNENLTSDTPAPTPPIDEIPEGGTGQNFELVGHAPLFDEHQYVGNESFAIPRGSNGDITVSGDCVYVGSLVGYQPPLIVDIEDPTDPVVIGSIPDAIPGVGNGIEGIEASGDVLVIDHRRALGGLGFSVPEGEPTRGLSVYDISDDCREPELVTRYDYGDLDVHTVSLWRDPVNPNRLLAVQSFTDLPNIKVIDLTGCPDEDECEPAVVAEWSLETQTGIDVPTHEAIMSTDGQRIYVSQYGAGVFLLNSSNLMDALRTDADCDPIAPNSTPGEEHCLTLLNPDPDARLDTEPPFSGEWHHTPLKVPGRPYLLATAEAPGPSWDQENEEVVTDNCPGAFTRLVYVGEDEYVHQPGAEGEPMRGDLYPGIVGVFGLPEQQLENCGPDGWEPDAAALPAWFSPHSATVFPDVAFVTYYGAGLRAIDISNPFVPLEAGHFFTEPVEEVRWASYGIQGETEYRDGGLALRRPAPGPNHMFAFSYPIIHDGHIIYADVHSGLYVLEYHGPHADQIPEDETCISGNPGAAQAGYEPCPPYGETDWGSTDGRGESPGTNGMSSTDREEDRRNRSSHRCRLLVSLDRRAVWHPNRRLPLVP